MKFRPAASAALVLALLPPALCQDSPSPWAGELDVHLQGGRYKDDQGQDSLEPNSPLAPRLDAKRIINESYGFLKEREPEMTEEEDALYQRVVLMVPTEPDFAMRLLENMLSGDQPVSAAFDFALANIYFNNGRRDDAETHYRSAIKKYPEFLRAWTNLGILCYSAGRYPDAITSLEKAITLGDRDAGTIGLMAYCLTKDGNPVAAEMAYLQALSLDPNNADWVEGLITVYQDSRQYARAEPLARRLIKLKPGESMSWLLYANILLSEGDKLGAAAILETAASLNAVDEQGLLLLGDLYAEQKLYPEAVATYDKVMARNPNLGAKRLAAYAQGLIAEHRLDQAESILQSAESNLTPESRSLWREARIDLYTAQERWPEAHREVAELLKTDPLNGKALLRLGQIYKLEGNAPKAAFAFEQAYRLSDFTYAASLELSNLSLQAHDYRKSIDYIETALRIQKSDALQDYLGKLQSLVPDNENDKNPQ